MSNHLPTQYQEYIHLSRYSRWLEDEGRRESWEETVTRYYDFFEEHLEEQHGYKLNGERKELEEATLNLEVMPSMRSIMTAGPALKRDNIAGYNCSYIAIDRITAFDEVLYILMNGTGVGFSVERQHVQQLPTVADEFLASKNALAILDTADMRATMGQRGRLAGGLLSYAAAPLLAGAGLNFAGNLIDQDPVQTDGTLMP